MNSSEKPKIIRALLIAMAVASLFAYGCAQQDHANENESDNHEEHIQVGQHDDSEEDEHGHEGEEEVVNLSPTELEEFGIEIAIAGPGHLDRFVNLPGEIVLNSDRLAHVPPRLSGIVREVFKTLGDYVENGEVLAVIESRELADAKAEYLAGKARSALAEASLEREQLLWERKISAKRDYLEARKALAEERVAFTTSQHKLRALGFSDVSKLEESPDSSFTYYEIKAPFQGTIIDKHITLGETLESNTSVFTIADLSSVWVDINVYQKDLAAVRKGQRVAISIDSGLDNVVGEIDWVGPLVGESTRTAKARVVLSNPNGDLRPGQFVTARVALARVQVDICVPKTAMQSVDDRTVIFVKTDDGFEPHQVETGQESETHIEIVSGLQASQSYASQGAFTLKTQLSKGAFDEGHSH